MFNKDMVLLVRVQPGCVASITGFCMGRGRSEGGGVFLFSFFLLFSSFLLPFFPFFLYILRFLSSKAHIGNAGSKRFQNPSELQPPSFS